MHPLKLSKTFGWKLYGIPKTFVGVSINSKTVKEGELFIPLKGKNFDGHIFIEEALRREAVGFLFQKGKLNSANLRRLTRNAFALEVEDTFLALRDLARLRRGLFKGKEIIAITGTAGKTTLKELLAHLLSSVGDVYKTPGNFNSQVGVPLTLANADINADYWVFELGASERGNIQKLVKLSEPTLGVLTSLGKAHLEGFKTFENLVREKGEIFNHPSVKKAVLPNGVKHFYSSLLEGKSFKTFEGLKHYRFTKEGKTLIDLEEDTVEVSLLGEGIVRAVSVALKVLELLNLPSKELLKEMLPTFKGERGRMQPLLGKGYLVIDDSYNANPLSMESALKTLVKVEGYSRRVAILGDMLELGRSEIEEHKKLGTLLELLPIDEIYLFGELTKYTCDKVKNKPCRWFVDKGRLLKVLKEREPKEGTVYLIKGSRGTKMEEVLQVLV